MWKLDRLGRNLHHLVNTVHDLTARGVGLKVLTGQGAAIDTTTAAGKLVFGIFAALAECERELISERTVAGLASARVRGRVGGRSFTMTPGKVRFAVASMGKPETNIGELCKELGISRQTLYRHVSPTGEIRPDGERVSRRSDHIPGTATTVYRSAPAGAGECEKRHAEKLAFKRPFTHTPRMQKGPHRLPSGAARLVVVVRGADGGQLP
ncbi:MAG: resolvase [Micrococcaceae bacterium]|nr:resolvase [Micrococcaceae bacterium]